MFWINAADWAPLASPRVGEELDYQWIIVTKYDGAPPSIHSLLLDVSLFLQIFEKIAINFSDEIM